MMMNDAKKKAVTIIAAEPKPMEEDSSMGYQAAAEDILLAINEKSPKRLQEALKAFVDICKYEEESENEMED